MQYPEKLKQAARWAGDWLRRETVPLVATTLIFALLAPHPANCQLFSPCCVQLSLGLSQINGSLVNTVGGGLSKIQSIENDVRNFEQTVLYPIQLIAQTRAGLASIWNQVHSIQGILVQPLHTATLANPQQLETVLLSRNATQIPSLTTPYQQVYGPIPAANTASPADINAIDMSDAIAEDAMKRAVVYDQMADQELQAADQMQQAINQAAPGTAPMIEASAAAWLVKSQAYTQSALGDLMRVDSITLANSSAGLKVRSGALNTLFQQTNQTLQR